jgi:hypothetical protein
MTARLFRQKTFINQMTDRRSWGMLPASVNKSQKSSTLMPTPEASAT